jgi:hypothetical protein
MQIDPAAVFGLSPAPAGGLSKKTSQQLKKIVIVRRSARVRHWK